MIRVKRLGLSARAIDDIPGEFWQCVADTEKGLAWLTELCNACWLAEETPADWHAARVASIYKKGSVEDCDNYRPISLICVTYKLFATILLRRLQEAGAERRLTTTQFGFRSGRSTQDAIFAVRRRIDQELAWQNGRVGVLALDWKKAFDSINVDAMITALGRFGLPDKLLRMVRHIYTDRTFTVIGQATDSSERTQRSGISQGCPLSPFLFVMLMTVIAHDAAERMPGEFGQQLGAGGLDVLLYADDTLLIGSNEKALQALLDSTAHVGAQYGMALHWSKFQLLSIGKVYRLHTPAGEAIAANSVMKYLGVNLHSDGDAGKELHGKIGHAWGDFCKLNRFWKRTSLSRARKIEVFESMIVGGLLYGLNSAWLNKTAVKRLNGFYCRCLRKILHIPHSFFSRVSNETVLKEAGKQPLDKRLLQQQLLSYGRVARAMGDDVLRQRTFLPGSLTPPTQKYVKKIGRPRNEWPNQIGKVAAQLNVDVSDAAAWKSRVATFCASS